jgi:serine protease inhibitor
LLPEFDNRSKGDKTIYQDEKYREKVNDLSMVESKYSFTKENDLEWLDLPYEPGDFDVLKEYYTDFLRKRFESQKEKFYESLGIM